MDTKATYSVVGMTCGHCVGSVRDKLSALVGVTAVDVELVSGGTSTVTVSSTAQLAADSVREAISEAGYTLAS